jgi:hypothetical protein
MLRSFVAALRSLLATRRSERDERAPREKSWEVTPLPDRVVAIGDLHGDVRALGAILRASSLVDGDGRWSGGVAHLVLVGDLIGGDRRSRLLVNAVMRLEREAMRAGGRVHALLGNHDILPVAGRFGKMTRSERALYTRHPVPDAPGDALGDVFRGDSVYARWMRARRAILKIGDTLFVHAGVDAWALDNDPDSINAAVRAWIAHWQGVGPRPKKGSRWTVAPRRGRNAGPLWTRSFKVRAGGQRDKKGPSKKMLRQILARYGVSRVVVGHAPTDGREIVLEHPRYGGAVVLIDTRISDEHRGRMSALTFERGAIAPIYVDDRDAGRFLEAREEAALASGQSIVLAGPFRRMIRWIASLFGA